MGGYWPPFWAKQIQNITKVLGPHALPSPTAQSLSILKPNELSTCTWSPISPRGAFSCSHQPEDSFLWTLARTHAVWPPLLHAPARCPCQPSILLPVGSVLLPSLSLSTRCSPLTGGWSLPFLLSDCSRQNSELASRFVAPGPHTPSPKYSVRH